MNPCDFLLFDYRVIPERTATWQVCRVKAPPIGTI